MSCGIMNKTELFQKSSRALSRYAWLIEKFGFLNPESENPRMQALITYVKELREMSKALAELT